MKRDKVFRLSVISRTAEKGAAIVITPAIMRAPPAATVALSISKEGFEEDSMFIYQNTNKLAMRGEFKSISILIIEHKCMQVNTAINTIPRRQLRDQDRPRIRSNPEGNRVCTRVVQKAQGSLRTLHWLEWKGWPRTAPTFDFSPRKTVGSAAQDAYSRRAHGKCECLGVRYL
jgi:hypothetical protein